MAYQNIPVSDGYQVIQQIANFAATVGWTVHRNEVRPADASYRIVTISASGTGPYITIIGNQGSLLTNGHRGLDTNLDWNNQPDQFYQGSQTDNFIRLRVNPINSVHFFGGMNPEPYIYLAIEKQPGYYRHLVLGHMVKFGNSLGGMFWDNSETDPNSASVLDTCRFPFVYNTNNTSDRRKGGVDCQNRQGETEWLAFAQEGNSHLKGGHWGEELYSVYVGTPIQFNSRTPLVTPLINVLTGNTHTPYGTPPNLRYLNMEYYEAGDELTIGSDVWKVFPMIRKAPGAGNGAANAPSDEGSGNYAIAYLKD